MPLLSAAGLLLTAAQSPVAPIAPPLMDDGRDRPALPDQDAKPVSRPADAIAVDATASGVPIKSVDFIGLDAPEIVANAARPFLGQPATRETLQALAKAISDAYGKSNIALYTVAIPQQDLSGGQVKVVLAEGFIEDITYPEGVSPLIRAYAERLRHEKPLTKRTLERYISLMRDIPGAKIDVGLLRGRQAGGVRVSITTKREHSDFSLGVDNSGQASLGRGQFQAKAQGYSLLQDGDRTELNLLASTDFDRFRYALLSHQTPIGSDGLNLGLSASYLDTLQEDVNVEGEAWTAAMSLIYPIIRGYRRNMSASLGVDLLNSDSAVLTSVISTDHIRSARAAIGYSSVANKSVLATNAMLSQGFDVLSARTTAGISEPVYTRISGRISFDRAFGKRLVGRVKAAGQYSKDRLPAAERFVVGGADFGRAFDRAVVSGDQGYAGSFEFAVRPKLPEKLKGSEAYAFIDGAKVRILQRLSFPTTSYDLASAGGGVRIAIDPLMWLELEGARVLDKPYPAAEDEWRFNISWRIKLGT